MDVPVGMHPVLIAIRSVARAQCVGKHVGKLALTDAISIRKGDEMDSSTIIRVVAGILFVLVVAVLVWRRKRTA